MKVILMKLNKVNKNGVIIPKNVAERAIEEFNNRKRKELFLYACVKPEDIFDSQLNRVCGTVKDLKIEQLDNGDFAVVGYAEFLTSDLFNLSSSAEVEVESSGSMIYTIAQSIIFRSIGFNVTMLMK